MSIYDTVLHVARSPWVKLMLPRWLGRLRKAWNDVFIAYGELEVK